MAFTQWRIWKTKGLMTPGRLSGEFLTLYAMARIFGELFREPDADLILGMSRGIFFSLFLLVLGIVLIGVSRSPAPKSI
jgi:phosphatidylglycerol:prolipoprotein diacylglycerol transferase